MWLWATRRVAPINEKSKNGMIAHDIGIKIPYTVHRAAGAGIIDSGNP